jgi:hypothetical protein
MELLGEWVMWNLVSICLETVLVSSNIGARFAPNVSSGLEIILDASEDTPR